MSKPEAPEPPPAVVLSVNAIIGGVFYAAGSALPFTSESDLPTSLKAFVATGNETPFQPAERNIYDMSPPLRRQARRLEMHAAHQEFAEQVAAAPLPEDVQAALEAEHDIAIGRARAQGEYSQRLSDETCKHLRGRGGSEGNPILRAQRRRMGARAECQTQAGRNMLRKARERRNGSRGRNQFTRRTARTGDSIMTFKLLKKSTGAVLTKFHVVNARGDIVGSINVANGEVNDLQKCWHDSIPAAATAAGKQARAVNAMVAAFRKGPRMNKEAILRGC